MKAFIFDLDGVLVHTDNLHYLAWKEIADKQGIEFNEEINNLLRGVSRMESLEIILRKSDKKYSQEEKNQLAEEKNNVYKKYLETMSPNDLDSGVLDSLNILKEKGYILAIGSSSKNAVTILDKLGIKAMFDVISDGNNIRNSKPDPEVFLYAATKLGLSPEECYVVEDAVAGVTAGVNGGFKVITINDAYSDDRATYRLKTFNEIVNI